MKRPPPVGPVIGDLLGPDGDQRLAGGRREIGQRRELTGGAVDRVLDRAVLEGRLLDATRGELQELREYQLGLFRRDAYGQAKQRR